jgi:hypothetical protein
MFHQKMRTSRTVATPKVATFHVRRAGAAGPLATPVASLSVVSVIPVISMVMMVMMVVVVVVVMPPSEPDVEVGGLNSTGRSSLGESGIIRLQQRHGIRHRI